MSCLGEGCSQLIIGFLSLQNLTIILSFQNETGLVGLEGAVCDDYYKIRELLYEQYAVV